MLKERIIKEVENEALRTGAMGTENVSVTLTLSDQEVVEYLELKLPDNYYYELGGNKLYVSYSEEV